MANNKGGGLNASSFRISVIFLYGFLLMGLYTFVMPAISITLPAFGKKSWSVHSIVRILPKDAIPEKRGTTDLNFKDILSEILPQDKETKEVKKFSLDFILAILIPIALGATYLLFVLNIFLGLLPSPRFITLSSIVCIFTAGYALVGTHLLGAFVKKRLAEKMAAMNEGIFQMVGRHFVKDTSIQPEDALYWLVVLSFLIFFTSLFRQLQNK